jgi:predicted nucleic acid-binding protein
MEMIVNKIIIDTNCLIKFIESGKVLNDIIFIITAPVLTEYLLGIKEDDTKDKIIEILFTDKQFDFLPFDKKSAIICSKLLTNFDKKQKIGSWQRVKFDFQIVAITKANNINTIMTTDEQVIKIANINNIECREER